MKTQTIKKSLIPTLLVALFCTIFASNLFASSFGWDTKQVQNAIKKNIAIIDIRTKEEFAQYGIIPTSHKLTFFDANGRYNEKQWLSDFQKIVKDKHTPFVIVCAHANRSGVIAKWLISMGYVNTHDLKGGIIYGWLDKGLKTTKK